MKHLLLIALWSSSLSLLHGQAKYWVFLRDKAPAVAPALGARALAQRARQGIATDVHDMPVSEAYLQAVRQRGIAPLRMSRWLNGFSAPLTPAQVHELAALPFVRAVQPVGRLSRPAGLAETCPDALPHGDTYLQQLVLTGTDALHRQGYTGEGVLIAVFDNGFLGVDTLAGFRHLFHEGRILATRDYVDGDETVYHDCAHCRHGTYVFSILAAVIPGRLTGSAPGASYLLLRTEEDGSETHQEEDNWVAAAEFADSMGAQIFTTSLGYFDFDAGQGDYTFADLDGNTTIITRAADLAASRGILVVNSAGNNGIRGINAPADGDSVLAVGSVDQCGEYSGFSSQGPSFDGRIKPDLTAMGEATFFLDNTGNVRRGNGTSFSCPLVSGLAACLLQAAPASTSMQLFDALLRSSDRYTQPDLRYGHGIPSAQGALALLGGSPAAAPAFTDPFAASDVIAYPNPARHHVYLAFAPGYPDESVEITLWDATGRQVEVVLARISQYVWQVGLPVGDEAPGLYVIRIQSPDLAASRRLIKVIRARE